MKTKRFFISLSLIISILSIIPIHIAWGESSSTSAGEVAESLFGVGMTVREIIRAICIMAGSCLIISSLINYKKHRQNPVEVTWGTIIFSFVSGVAIICLSFIPISV